MDDLLALLAIAAFLGAIHYTAIGLGKKLSKVALTLQGHRREASDGFRIVDEYPPQPNRWHV